MKKYGKTLVQVNLFGITAIHKLITEVTRLRVLQETF